jgi:hypothetical protein
MRGANLSGGLMSKVEPGPNDGAAFLNGAFSNIMAGMAHVSPDDFAVRMIEKLIADGLLEMKPGYTKEQAASMFTAAFKTLKVKIPSMS